MQPAAIDIAVPPTLQVPPPHLCHPSGTLGNRIVLRPGTIIPECIRSNEILRCPEKYIQDKSKV